MVTPGPAVPVNASGQFTQTGNSVAANGVVHVTYDTTFGTGDAQSDDK